MRSKVWGEITYPFPNFNARTLLDKSLFECFSVSCKTHRKLKLLEFLELGMKTLLFKQWITFQIPDVNLGFRVGKMWKYQISTILTRPVYLSTGMWNISSHGSVPENSEQTFKYTMSNPAQKTQFCKNSWNRQCCDGHIEDDLPISVW